MTRNIKREKEKKRKREKMPKIICAANECKSKLDLVAQSLVCKCQKSFCAKHRNSTDHACSFDYKMSAKEQLLRYMSSPVLAPKLSLI
jgi:hypothetical protein